MSDRQNTLIESIGIYLPTHSVSTGEIMEGCTHPIRFPIEKITGIKCRSVASKNEFSIDLARKAVEDCFSNSAYAPEDIDLLICCNISRYDALDRVTFEPGTAVKLRHEFGFKKAIVFDLSNACAGMFTAIHIVDACMKSGIIDRAMVVSGEYITHLADTAQREIESYMDQRMACLTLGDAGAAVILERSADARSGFQAIDILTRGRYSPFCIAKPAESGGWVMHTDSVNLTGVAVKSGAGHSTEIVQRSGWEPGAFQHLIMHQTSKMSLQSAMKEINSLYQKEICNNENTVNNLEIRGNTASTSHFVALADLLREGRISKGDRVIFSVSASGLTTGTALYVFDDLPTRMAEGLPGKMKTEPPAEKPTGTGHVRKRDLIEVESAGISHEGEPVERDSMSLLKKAASHCLARSAYDPGDIDLLLFAGIYRNEHVLEPAYATFIAGEMKMNDVISGASEGQTLAFDVFNGSVGFLNACFVAQQMIASRKCRNAMIIAAESIDDTAPGPEKHHGIRETGGALIVQQGSERKKGFSAFHFSYPENGVELYRSYVDTGKPGTPVLHILKNAHLEEAYLAHIPSAVETLLAREGIDPSRVALFIPPQISTSFINRLKEKMDIADARFIDATGGGPDLFSASIPYAFKEITEKQLATEGDLGIVISVGSGIQVGCAVYHF